ncbi:MAG: hypothetical protein LBM66_04115, partial [Bifidobacteriaceae bacterium]|nr:hypothetical protein [Bifidobacteriaceae bacterium]
GYWTRANDTEIDIVATDKAPVGDTIEAIGSIKWYSSHPFDSHDFDTLAAARQLVPGATPSTPLIVVSRTGASVPGVTVVTPDQLLSASSAPNEPMSE